VNDMSAPDFCRRFARLFSHDTSMARLIVAAGLVLLGAAMLLQVGEGAPGYRLLEQALPLPMWGALYLGAGLWGFYGAVNRLGFYARIALTLTGMYAWVFIALAQFADQPLPTRTLLVLPALVEAWVLVKVVVYGKRECKC
jgi:hypothetical protein